MCRSKGRVLASGLLCASLLAACHPSATPEVAPASSDYGALSRVRFNQMALRLNEGLFWEQDRDEDGAVDPDEVRALRFYQEETVWVEGGTFTGAFVETYARMVQAERSEQPADPRLRLVQQELDSVAPTLVYTDLRGLPEIHREFVGHILAVVDLIDGLYARQTGMRAMREQLGSDLACRSLFRRNWGTRCRGAATEGQAACSAIEGAPAQPVDVYPASLQQNADFCQQLEAQNGAAGADLLDPFTAVRQLEDGALMAVPYPAAYPEEMSGIAAELRAAASAMTDPEEAALVHYLEAAAQAFSDNIWGPADEAWAAMNAHNSRYYLRVAPDEVYWDPCSHKAGFHVTFALINRDSLRWQQVLTPLQGRMEQSLASLSERYEPRDVSFHMPDFIDIVVNAGDDRDPFGATIGQSLPNWGAVADEGRGRTVAMSNFYTDPDSQARRRAAAESLLTAEALAPMTGSQTPGLLSTMLHEATHNLGPAHEHRVEGRTAAEAFGGGMASMLEELKAQSGALYFLQLLREQEIIEPAMVNEAYLDSITWAFGHISRGMYTPDHHRKAYSQLAAVQIGFLMEHGVLNFDPEARAANGTDVGAFSIDYSAFDAATVELMRTVMAIKAGADREAAEAIAARYVDGDVVPQDLIRDRLQRQLRAGFVYSLDI